MRRNDFSASRKPTVAQHHLRVAVTGHVSGVTPHRADGVLDDIDCGQAARERRSEPQTVNREGLLQPFEQAGRHIRISGRQPFGLLLQFRHAFFIQRLVSGVHHALDLGGHFLLASCSVTVPTLCMWQRCTCAYALNTLRWWLAVPSSRR